MQRRNRPVHRTINLLFNQILPQGVPLLRRNADRNKQWAILWEKRGEDGKITHIFQQNNGILPAFLPQKRRIQVARRSNVLLCSETGGPLLKQVFRLGKCTQMAFFL